MTTPTTIDYALMAGASYISSRLGVNQFPAPDDWVSTNYKNPPDGNGFEAISFVPTGTTLVNSTQIVISYAGTGPDWGDWIHGNTPLALGVLGTQLKEAADYYLQVKASAPAGSKGSASINFLIETKCLDAHA